MDNKGAFMKVVRVMNCFAVMMFAAGLCFGQGYEAFDSRGGFAVFGGAGVTNPSNATHGSIHLGADFEMNRVVDFKKNRGIPAGFIFEFGYAGPVNDLGNGSALISTNYLAECTASRHIPLTVFATAGYTRLFGTGNALNFGGGINLYSKNGVSALRFEVRDYYRKAGSREHSVAFRIGYSVDVSGV
jgi:hypothetical protein